MDRANRREARIDVQQDSRSKRSVIVVCSPVRRGQGYVNGPGCNSIQWMSWQTIGVKQVGAWRTYDT